MGYARCMCCDVDYMAPYEDYDPREDVTGPNATLELCEVCAFMGCGEGGDSPSCVDCIVDGQHGIYVGQSFAQRYLMNPGDWGVSAEDREILLAGPYHADYLDVWEGVIDSGEYASEIKRRIGPPIKVHYMLEQDGDLCARAISVDRYEIDTFTSEGE
jgi:hypothetical protein